MDYLKVEIVDFYRDPDTGAIVNRNDSEYDAYLKNKRVAIKKQEIDQLKNDVSELKDMMKLVLEKLDKQLKSPFV